MLLTVSIENTYISLGVFEGEKLVADASLSTSDRKSLDEYAILISGILGMNGIPANKIDGAIISSVVRPLNAPLRGAIEKIIGVHPLLLGPGIKTGLSIKTDFATQIGGDIVANAVAANTFMPFPYVIVDLGTATTLSGINAKGELAGVIICPGALSALTALSENAAELPYIAIETPRELLGKNTIDSMTSGIVYGHASMIDGFIDRISDLWQTGTLKIVATGDLSNKILTHSKYADTIHIEPHLTLIGLKKIYSLNTKSWIGS